MHILDPFVKINFLVDGTRISKKRTHMKKRTLNPVYNESFVFDLPSTVVDLHNVCIEFCVFDHDRVTKNEVSLTKRYGFYLLQRRYRVIRFRREHGEFELMFRSPDEKRDDYRFRMLL